MTLPESAQVAAPITPLPMFAAGTAETAAAPMSTLLTPPEAQAADVTASAEAVPADGERRPWSKIPEEQKRLPASSIEKLRAAPTLDVTAEVTAAATAVPATPAPNETAPKVIISRYLAPPPPTEMVRIPAVTAANPQRSRRRDASAWMPVALLVALVCGLAVWRIMRTPAAAPPIQQAQALSQNKMTQAPPQVARASTPNATVVATPSEPKPTITVTPEPIAPEPKPVAVAPTEPEPVAVAPTEPKPVAVTPTEPKPVAVAPTEPKLVAVAPTEPKPAEPVVASSQPVGPITVSPTAAPPKAATAAVSMARNPRAAKYDNVPPRAAPWHTNTPPLAADKPVVAYVPKPKNTYDDKPPLAAKAKLGAEVVNADKKVRDYDAVPPAAAADANRPRVLLMSQPPGATVLVGGREIGQTPVTIKLDGNGDAPVVLRRPGYQPETMVLQSLLTKRSVTVVLSPAQD